MFRRTALAASLAILVACGHSTPRGQVADKPNAVCPASDLTVCERRIAQAMAQAADAAPWVDAYLSARASSVGVSDSWVVLWNRLKAMPAPARSCVVVGSAKTLISIGPELRSRTKQMRPSDAEPLLLDIPEFPVLRAARPEELLLAMARRANIAVLGWVREADVVVVLGADPLAPLIYDVPAWYVESRTLLGASPGAEIARTLSLELSVNDAVALLGALQYREAAQVVDGFDADLRALDPKRAGGLRARMVSSRSGLFGMEARVTEQDKKDFDPHKKEDPAKDFSRVAEPEQGPYAAWLRTLQSKNEDKKAWSRQRAIVAQGVSTARLDALDFVYDHDASPGPEQRCEVSHKAAPVDLERGELLFANKLAQLATQGVIPPGKWARAYDAMVNRVEATRTGWYMMASLLFQRGELPGMSARGSSQYKRVTRLALDHLDALSRFQTASPSGYQPSGQLLVAFSPGATSDPQLASVLQRLMADNVKYKLAPAAGSKKVMELVLMGSMSAVSFPEPMRSAYLGAVAKELHDKLHGEFLKQSGWDVALLYAAGALGEYLTRGEADLTFAGDQITRALEARSDIEVRPMAVLTARGAQYAALGASNQLQADKVSPLGLGDGRKGVRARLRDSLKELGGSGEPVAEATLSNLTTLLDGMIATAVLMGTEARKRPTSTPTQCIPGPTKPSPKLQRNFRELAEARNALGQDHAFWSSNSSWARRSRMLVVILSDMLDIMDSPSGAEPRYRLSDVQAARAVREGLAEWTSKDVADGAGALVALVRAGSREKDGWKTLADRRGEEIATLLRGVNSLVGSDGSMLSQVAVKAGIGMVQSAAQGQGAAPKSGMNAYVQAFYDTGHPDHAALALLLSNVSGIASIESARQAEALAMEHKSPSAWALATRRAVREARIGHPLDAAELERGLRLITDDRCKVAQVDPVISAGQAVARFGKGDREGGARALDDLLLRAETEGLVVPRVHYRLSEHVSLNKRLILDVHMTSAQGFVGENSMSLGLEVFSDKKPPGLKIEVLTNQAEDAGRLFAHLASVASVYHFLQGHDALGAYDAARALQAIRAGVRLGPQVVVPSSKKWATDSDESLLLLSELAVRRNQPLLAADLLRAVPKSDSAAAGGSKTAAANASPALLQAVSLRSLTDIQEPMARAQQSLELLGKVRSCDAPKPAAAPEAATCEELRRGIALWRAGAWSSPPKMRRGVKDACRDDETLIDILQQFDGRKPATGWSQVLVERTTKWMARAVDSGYSQEAITVLRIARDAGVCSPGMVEVAQRAARRHDVPATDSVDWLSYALSCPGRRLDEATWEDLSKLAEAGGRLVDSAAIYRIEAAVVRFMVAQQAWQKLHEFVTRPAFVDHLNRVGPSGAAIALVLAHASAILCGKRPDLEGTNDRYQVACILFGDGGREGVCRELGMVRNRALREPPSQLADTCLKLVEAVSLP